MQVKGLHRGDLSKYFVHSCPLEVYYFTFTYEEKIISCPGHFFTPTSDKKIFCIKIKPVFSFFLIAF